MSRSLQDTTLWSMISNTTDMTFEHIQEYLMDTKSDEDIGIIKSTVDSWGVDPAFSINEKWVVQLVLLASRPADLGVDTSSEIYQRAKEWMDMLIEQPDSADFLKKTITLKIVYDNWRKKDMKEQMHVLVEMYLYYQEILLEFDFFLKMKEEQDKESANDASMEDSKSTTDETTSIPDEYDQSIFDQIYVWRDFYTEFSATLFDLIKMFAPKNHMSWIEGTMKQKQEQLRNHPELMERMVENTRRKLRWSFWKEREYRYIQGQNDTVNRDGSLMEWRRELVEEWSDIVMNSTNSEILDKVSDKLYSEENIGARRCMESDEALLIYMVDMCSAVDKSAMKELYQYIVSQYESGNYTYIECISILFQRWWNLCSSSIEEK